MRAPTETSRALEEMLDAGLPPSIVPDNAWIQEYLARGSPAGDPIMLSIGEPWTGPPRGLIEALHSAPSYCHGYQLSMYGLPRLRGASKEMLYREHQLTAVRSDIEVAITWTGTRSAMFDFGRLLRDHIWPGETPNLLATSPGWDYAGVFEPLGFRTTFIPLRAEERFQPDAGLIADEIRRSRSSGPTLLVLNSQHNPTAVNWTSEVVAETIDAAISSECALLLDDAYFSVHDPGIPQTSALRLLLEAIDSSRRGRPPWLAVRSLGKQYNCNGWGIGVMTSDPHTLEFLVSHLRTQHQFNCGAIFQHALADWIPSVEARAFVERRNRDLASARRQVSSLLGVELGFPPESIFGGSCT